jgi:hypothetical protein
MTYYSTPVLCLVFALTACGNSSSNGPNTNTNTNPEQVAEKTFKLDFLSNGCLGAHNADAVTDFQFANNNHRMLSWRCVTGAEQFDGAPNFDLFIKFDKTAACYKKIEGDELNAYNGLLFNGRVSGSCASAFVPIAQPQFAGQILSFDVVSQYKESQPNGFRYGVLLSGSWQNTGNIPIAQYRETILIKRLSEPAESVPGLTEESYNSDNLLLPGEIGEGHLSDLSGSGFELGAQFEFTFIIKDYYGAIIASASKQITIE